jgi:hypothetical protein
MVDWVRARAELVLPLLLGFALLAPAPGWAGSVAGLAVFNVKDYGATGRKDQDARPAIQQALDACAAAGGGMVYLPPGQYTSGTLRLRSHVRFHLEAGATLFASLRPADFDCGQIPSKAALLYGEDLENVTIEGRGTIDGQAQYEWRPDDFERAFDHKQIMQRLGKPLLRPFPKGFPGNLILPHLLWLGRCQDVQVRDLSLLHSPSWTAALYGCQKVMFDGLRVYTSLREGVWADGIDLDGCRDVFVSNCVIETGDDCLVFISTDAWGPALPCENIHVTNCRLSSASAGVKFSEGNRVCVRNVVVSNSVLTNVNRGFVFSITFGGLISDVLLSNLIIDSRRFDWFWAGDGQPFHFRITRVSELNQEPPEPGEAPPGTIRNVVVRDVIAHARGSSRIHGHPESWLDGLRFENVKLFLSADSAAPFDRAEHALQFRWARNLRLKDVEVSWDKPALDAWKSALDLEDIRGLVLDGFFGNAAWPDRNDPAVMFNRVSEAVVRNARAQDGTRLFLEIKGRDSRDILLQGNDLRKARVPWKIEKGIPASAVKKSENLLPR